MEYSASAINLVSSNPCVWLLQRTDQHRILLRSYEIHHWAIKKFD